MMQGMTQDDAILCWRAQLASGNLCEGYVPCLSFIFCSDLFILVDVVIIAVS